MPRTWAGCSTPRRWGRRNLPSLPRSRRRPRRTNGRTGRRRRAGRPGLSRPRSRYRNAAWPIRRARTRRCGPPPARRAPASRRRRRRSCWSSASWSRFPSVAWHAAEHLEDHPEVVLGVEVGDVDPAVLTAEHHAVLALGPRDGLPEVRRGDGDVVHALSLLGEETSVDAVLVERLDELPHHPADRSHGDAVGALCRLSVLAVVACVAEVDPSELPRADPVVVLVPAHRCLQIAHDDAQLHRLVED